MIPLALTMGDPAGIAGEITAGAWRALRHSGPEFVLIADPDWAAALGVPTRLVETFEGDGFADAIPVMAQPMATQVSPGVPDPANAPAIIGSIATAVRLALEERASAVVTNPIAKYVLTGAGFPHPGHTEFLAELTGCVGRAVMMLCAPDLRVVPVTVHVSLRRALDELTTERIVAVAHVVDFALQRDFGIVAPRLAIAGLNPHAGENATMGEEDRDIIAPAVAALRAEGLRVTGPHSPDAMFAPSARASYDVAICMYHDQALIPLKTIDMAGGVNVTLGLPIVRTSPDHGTAFDIAGRGRADPSSLIASLHLARGLSLHRSGR